MKFKEAVQILGYKLEEKYRALGFKYKKSDRTLTMHSKNFTYMIAFFSFSGNTNEKIDVDVFSKALKLFFKDKDIKVRKLIKYSKELKIDKKVREYLEVLIWHQKS